MFPPVEQSDTEFAIGVLALITLFSVVALTLVSRVYLPHSAGCLTFGNALWMGFGGVLSLIIYLIILTGVFVYKFQDA